MGKASAGPFTWPYDRAEIVADAIVHACGVMLAVVGTALLLVLATRLAPASELAAVIVYAGALNAVFTISAAYNLWPVSPVKWVLRRIDHSAIYLLIAGTYTPFLTQVKADLAAIVLLVGVWVASLFGGVLKLALPGRFDGLAVVLYLALGWSGVMAYDTTAGLPRPSPALLLAGGVLYTVGVVFHLWRSLRFHNAVWHGFVLAAAGCHYGAVLVLVRSPG